MADSQEIKQADDGVPESNEISRLRAELQRLVEKRLETTDPDILSVLSMRISDLEGILSSSASELPILETEEDETLEEPAEIQKLRQELAKLQEKRAQTKDKNIIAVLDLRIMQIQPTLPPPPKAKKSTQVSSKVEKDEDESDLEPIEAPTPAQVEAAEKLIRQSMLEKRRGNAAGATDYLKKAANVAPGSAVVLEALGDDLLERKLTKQAREAFKKALKIDPKNVGVERKYAQTVLQTTSKMSVEDQLRLGMSDSLFLTGEDNVAGLTAARFLSGIIPGVGQLVLGRTTKGLVLFVLWAVLVGWVCLWNKDFLSLMKFVEGKGPSPSSRIFIPLIGMAVVWIGSMMDLGGRSAKEIARHSKVDRPKPPVDLPFD